MAMTKVVYNACFGGFGLSEAAIRRYAEIKGMGYNVEVLGNDASSWSFSYLVDGKGNKVRDDDLRRDDPVLVQVVEELGEEASDRFADLRIAELEPGTRYRIDEYDGRESVMTMDDYDWSVA